MIYIKILLINMMFFLSISSCFTSKKPKLYTVNRVNGPVKINGNWDKEPWNTLPSIDIDNHMGEKPDHLPGVQAKLAYDQEAVYVIFKVKDQYVRCLIDEYQAPVSRDSCVEFFFAPGTDITKGYFNLEVNCGGTAVFKFQKMAKDRQIKIPKSEFDKIEIAHSLPKIVNPEIKDPINWTVEYRLPFEILKKYIEVVPPAPGVEWKANFYKIASESSHPHYLTWSYVDNPIPQFHMPEFFGTLIFQ